MPLNNALAAYVGIIGRVVGVLLAASVASFPLVRARGDGSLALRGYAAVGAALVATYCIRRWRRGGTLLDALSRVPARTFAVGLFALALALRLAALSLFPIFPTEDAASDPFQTELAAWNLSQGVGYVRTTGPDVHWPPGYALFASALYLVAGRSWVLLSVMNCALDALTTLLTYQIGRRVWSEGVGRAAGLLYAGNLYMVLTCQNLHYYTLLGVLLTAYVLLVRGSSWLLGPLLGGIALVKPIALAIPPLHALALGIAGRPSWRVVKQTALVATLMLLAISPWTARNYHTFDRFVLIAANGGSVLWRGNNPAATGFVMAWPESLHQARREMAAMIDWDHERGQEARAWIRENPGAFLALVPKKHAYTFGTQLASLPDLEHFGPSVMTVLRSGTQVFYLVLALCAALTLVEDPRRLTSSPEGAAAVLIVALMFAIHSIMPGYCAHHGPVLSLLSVMAAGAIGGASRRLEFDECGPRRRGRT